VPPDAGMEGSMREFGKKYQVFKDENTTKNRILLESVRLFAMQGYATVSMRDIAAEVGIRPSAIYNHYQGKDVLLDAILETEKDVLNAYYKLLEQENQKVENFQQVVDNLYIELRNVTSNFSYYALNVALNTQYLYEKARELYFDIFLVKGRAMMKSHLDAAIERELVEPFDTAAISSFMSSSVIAMNTIRIGQFNGYYLDFDFQKWYSEQMNYVLSSVKIKNSKAM